MPPDVFQWDRAVPPEWQDQLDLLCPGPNVSRLLLYWQAGFPNDPVQRWEIYEVQPYSAVEQMLSGERKKALLSGDDPHGMMVHQLWAALNGPDPRTIGRWVKHKDKGKRWVSKSLVSQAQWRLHEQTGGLPMRTWIIEGHKGGHAWQFGRFERSFLLATGTEPELIQAMDEHWPKPGSLPYAEFNNLVMNALSERDQLAQWRASLAWDDRIETNPGDLQDFEAKRRHEQMAERMMVWLDNQIGDAVSDIPRTLLPQWSDYQRADGVPDVDAAHLALLKE